MASKPKFQSFLIVGNNNEQETHKIATQFNIDPEKPSADTSIIYPQKKSISIDQVREIKAQINQKPFSQTHKLIIIKNAQSLTKEAQNSLLKIFEEPPSHALIILEAASTSDLLPTIVSRAVVIRSSPKQKVKNEQLLDLTTQSTAALLEEISLAESSEDWLNSQMNSLHELLLEKVKGKKPDSSFEQIQTALEKCAEAKKMINANVNAKFVLADLIFSLNPSP